MALPILADASETEEWRMRASGQDSGLCCQLQRAFAACDRHRRIDVQIDGRRWVIELDGRQVGYIAPKQDRLAFRVETERGGPGVWPRKPTTITSRFPGCHRPETSGTGWPRYRWQRRLGEFYAHT